MLLKIVTLLLIIRLWWSVVISFFSVPTLWSLSDLLCSPEKDFQQPSENENKLMSFGLMFWSAEATVGRKIDLFCDGVFAVWFLIINGSYKGRLALWYWGAANLMFTIDILCWRNVSVVATLAKSQFEVVLSTFNELFARKCITLNKERAQKGKVDWQL